MAHVNVGLARYKPSGRSWPGGQRAAESRLAARREQEHFPAPPAAPRSDPTSPARTRYAKIKERKVEIHTDTAGRVSSGKKEIEKRLILKRRTEIIVVKQN